MPLCTKCNYKCWWREAGIMPLCTKCNYKGRLREAGIMPLCTKCNYKGRWREDGMPLCTNVIIKAGEGRMVCPCAWAEWYPEPICIFPRWNMVSQWRGFRLLLQVYYFSFYWTLTVWDSYKYGMRKWHLRNCMCFYDIIISISFTRSFISRLIQWCAWITLIIFLCFMYSETLSNEYIWRIY